LVPTAAAIGNAIYDAVGVRIKSLPITPDKILAALEEKDSISKRCGNER
jgi:CO/xanthine dehydrogenase Mo-binding subunit